MRGELSGEKVKCRKRTIIFDVIQLDSRQRRVVCRARYAVGVRERATANALRVVDGYRYRFLVFPLAV